jgi:hypothetical protein
MECDKGLCKLNRESEITQSNITALGIRLKKENMAILILSIIGLVLGLIGGFSMDGGDVASVFGVAWIGIGLGAVIAFGIFNGWIKKIIDKKGSDEDKENGWVLGIIGAVAGPIFTIIMILRRRSWLKKCGTILINERELLKSLNGVRNGETTEIADAGAVVDTIVRRFVAAKDGLTVKKLKQMW